jgi:lipopolysaccharide exporter
LSDSLSPSELRAKTLRGLRWTVIARPTTEVVAVGTMLILARLIGPAEFGRYAVATVVASLALIPGTGIGSAVVQRAELSRDYLQAAFALVLLSAVVIVLLAFAVAGLVIAPVFGSRTADLVRLTTPLCFVSAGTSLSYSLLQRRLEFRRLGLIDVASSVAASAVSIALAVAGFGA